MPIEPDLYVLNVNTRSVIARVRLNDITVYTNPGRQAMYGEKINPLLLPHNTISISLALPPPVPAAKASPSEPPQFKLTVRRGQRDSDPTQAALILRYEWSAGQSPLTPLPAEVFRDAFDAAISWRPRWTSLAPIPSTDAELQQFVLRFAAYLRARDIEPVVALHAPKFSNLADSLGLDAAETSASFRSYLQQMMSDPAWQVPPVEVARLRFAREAEGRMVLISLDSGEPPIFTHNSNSDLPFTLTVCVMNDEVQIIR